MKILSAIFEKPGLVDAPNSQARARISFNEGSQNQAESETVDKKD